MAAAANDGLKGFEGILVYLVKSAVEGNLHRGGNLHYVTGTLLVNTSVGGKKAHHNGTYSVDATAHLHLSTDGVVFFVRVAKVARTRPHQHMDAQAAKVGTGENVTI